MTRLLPTVFHVDSDAALRRQVEVLGRSAGLVVNGFETAAAFLEACRPEWPGCLVLDLQLPDQDGLDLLAGCARQGVFLPAVVVTGNTEVPQVVLAMKRGAVEVLEKPCTDQALLDAIHEALARDAWLRRRRARHLATGQALALLTPTEREVLCRMLAGKGYKQIATDLDVCSKTVETHRTRLRKKLGCHDLTQLLMRVLGYQLWFAALSPWERQHQPQLPSWLPDE